MTDNTLRLYGSVGASWWDEGYFTSKTVMEWLEGREGPITVRINSGGGIADEGQMIYTLLKDYPAPVEIVVDGVAWSAASLIAMAGDKIVMRMGATMLIHDPAQIGLGRGTEADHLTSAAQLRVIADAYAEIYAARARISRKEARQIMRGETMLDGALAVQMGFADEVEATEAMAAARFDYRLYANAPSAMREASEALGNGGKVAALVMVMAGTTPPKERENTMENTSLNEAAEDVPAVVEQVETLAEEAEAPITASADTERERRRARRITETVMLAGLPASMAVDMIARGLGDSQVIDTILKHRQEAAQMNTPIATVSIRKDEREKFREGAALAIMHKAGLGGERNEFSSLSLTELARESLVMAGQPRLYDDRTKMIGLAFTMAGGHSTSDFANILASVQGKAVLRGWDEAEETFEKWTRKGVLTDFKTTKRVGAGLFSSLSEVVEGAEYSHGTVGDRGEEITLATYGKMITISRQAIINDDLSILGDLPRKMGRAAKRTVGNLVYAILTGNPNMGDGVALFHSSHGNLAGSGGAPSIATLGSAKTAMMIQKEATGGPSLNLRPKFIIAPVALEMTISQFLNSTVDPTASKGHASNPVANMAELVTDARLDDASATAWYLASDPSMHDTIEVAYLDGNSAPYVEQQGSWTTDGVQMKVRIDAAAKALDFRTLYKNAGA